MAIRKRIETITRPDRLHRFRQWSIDRLRRGRDWLLLHGRMRLRYVSGIIIGVALLLPSVGVRTLFPQIYLDIPVGGVFPIDPALLGGVSFALIAYWRGGALSTSSAMPCMMTS